MAAFGIMIYHYLSWTLGKFSAETFMGRLGIYGVSIFYILSGLTLYYVYYDKMKPSQVDVLSFFKKRVFRIFPLLWLVTITAVLLSGTKPDFTNLFLNLSGLFGFVRWDKYFSAGVWSIGNELVFYVLFPFFILFIKRFKPLMILLALVLFGLYLYFAFVKLDPAVNLNEQWKNYVNPLNQVFLFLGGFLIGFLLRDSIIKNWVIVLLLFLASVLFAFYPATGNTINLVTGVNRLIFTATCFITCICFYKMTFKFPTFIHKPLTLLGEASYSVYLLHPIVWSLTGIFSEYVFNYPVSVRLILSVLSTLVISYFVYQYFEKYFMKLGRRSKTNPE
jgi:peptidoglycan/LPS O-acetylase OafA/YrhL